MYFLWLTDLLLPFCTYPTQHPVLYCMQAGASHSQDLTLGSAYHSLCAAQPFDYLGNMANSCPLTCCSPLLH